MRAARLEVRRARRARAESARLCAGRQVPDQGRGRRCLDAGRPRLVFTTAASTNGSPALRRHRRSRTAGASRRSPRAMRYRPRQAAACRTHPRIGPAPRPGAPPRCCPARRKDTIGPTSGRCQSWASTASRRHIRLKSWVGPSTSSPVAPRSPANRSRPCGGDSSTCSPSSKRRRRPLPLQQHQFAFDAGECENAASCSISAIDNRQSQSPRLRRPCDLAGPAESVLPALAPVAVRGNDSAYIRSGIHAAV